MKYRIRPYGESSWVVQSRAWWFPFWLTDIELVGLQTFMVVEHETESDAENSIRLRLEWAAKAREAKARARARKASIPAREYP